jgi:hypothetical protein
MLKKIYFLFFVGVSLLGLTSCLNVGAPFSSDVTWIKAGSTSKQDIERVFGPPFRVGYDSGFKTFTYGYYKYSLFAESQTKDLVIRFNDNNIVSNFTFSSSFIEDKNKLKNQ